MPRHLQKESSQRTSVRARSSSSTGRRTSRPEFPSKSGFSHPPRRLPSAGTPWCSASSIPKWVVWCFIHSLVIMSSFVRLDHAWLKPHSSFTSTCVVFWERSIVDQSIEEVGWFDWRPWIASEGENSWQETGRRRSKTSTFPGEGQRWII